MTGPLDIELWEAFGSGVYLLFGIIHLDLWLRRRDRMEHLWLACASGSALLVDVTGLMARRLVPEPGSLVLTLNALGVAGATASLFALVSALNRTRAGLPARALQVVLAILAVVVGTVTSAAGPSFLALAGFLLLWAAVRAIRAARRGDREAGTIARGFIVLIACLIADVLQELGVHWIPSGLPILGFIVLFLTSARSLNDRFGREEEASRTDSLTGLPNRRGFLEAGDGAIVRSRRSGLPLSVVLSDLDHFKLVNDTLGHAAGDQALRAIADAIRSALRGQDVAARWGGEEFIVLLPDTDRGGAVHVAEALRAAIARLALAQDGTPVALTLSLGVAEHRSGRGLEETIAAADAALYEAKRAGRNRVVAS